MKPTTITAVRVRRQERREKAAPAKRNGRHPRGELARRRDAIVDALDERVHDARRTARRARFLTEDVSDGTAILLRRHPFRSMAVAFVAGIGLALGARRLLG